MALQQLYKNKLSDYRQILGFLAQASPRLLTIRLLIIYLLRDKPRPRSLAICRTINHRLLQTKKASSTDALNILAKQDLSSG